MHAKSEYNTFVAEAAGDSFAVEIFKQRDSIFAGNAGEVFEDWHRDSVSLGLLESSEFGAKFGQGIAMKDEFRCDAVEGFVSQQDLQQFFRPTRTEIRPDLLLGFKTIARYTLCSLALICRTNGKFCQK